jgi:hypothetical protein
MTKRSKGDSQRQHSGRGMRPKAGVADSGRTVDPKSVSDDREAGRAARAPGLPMSQQEYERLKREAETVPIPRSKHRQEDPSGKT